MVLQEAQDQLDKLGRLDQQEPLDLQEQMVHQDLQVPQAGQEQTGP